ncbi:taste receptor type 2 member 1 [Tupaia chinensis]|uniref:Taste receptor type 2 n=1 Tax=Tupaia chinensis TaxID=246437 RepID=L9L8W7_TUPCH|nr:taste receptor type 2 member 1 [Tupaia chinensis]ELW70157.1 Taste receptor type 2 member 1 [Tupaia chinensis]
MLTFHFTINFLFSLVQLTVGAFANGIIVVVNGSDLLKQRKMATVDLLLFCLAVSRICLQLVIFYLHLLVSSFMEFPIYPANFVAIAFVNESGLWLATWLGVFYCAKIATFPHPLFFWLKMRISKLVPWLILGSLLFVALASVFHRKYTWPLSQKYIMAFFSKNTTQCKEIPYFFYYFFFLEFSLPFLIFLTAVLLLVYSLGRHTQQMRTTARGPGSLRRSVPASALCSILAFLILYFSHYMVAALLAFKVFDFRSLVFQLSILFIGTYPSGHSIILILGNPRLKQNAKKFFLTGKCFQ